MNSTPSENKNRNPFHSGLPLEFGAYWLDAWQRSVLMLDVMRQRGNSYREAAEKTAPNVLKFDYELIADGRKMARPVNYALVRITPPDDIAVDVKKRPFVVVDPRAGHGPGIGGFKADSEIGVALKAGHPCYFIGFLPEPVAGQTIEDVMLAEAHFLEQVIALHPDAEGKPAVIGNCQAGWAVMMLAAVRPELFGPILIAGAPLSYWAGERGKNPMRYTGGMLGGSWLAALMSDLGHGTFDGAWLVSNFENLNPANTYWAKQYDLYAKVDTEAPRYLEFEKWWGGHVLLNAEEIQFIIDQLFVGNKLSSGDIVTRDGMHVDMRSIRSPIIVFCSQGDNITPPQQALGWITDMYDTIEDIRSHGQTIVYTIHESAGHLGIFVSGSVAKKEHDKFTSNIDMIDVLPPGLYEAVISEKDAHAAGADLISGGYHVRFEPRDLDDIRRICSNSEEDDRKFAAVSQVSRMNLGLYRTLLQPWVKTFSNESVAHWMREMHPLRLQYKIFSDENPFMRALAPMADRVRDNRKPATAGNLLWEGQENMSRMIQQGLQSYGDVRDRLCEQLFHTVYGAPFIQAMAGFRDSDTPVRHRPGKNVAYMDAVQKRIDELKARIGDGGLHAAAIRALLYIRSAEGAADERGMIFMRHLQKEHSATLSLTEFKNLVREQFFMLILDESAALAAIPGMLAADTNSSKGLREHLHKIIGLVGLKTDEGKRRLIQINAMFAGTEQRKTKKKTTSPKAPVRKTTTQEASPWMN